MSKPSTSRGLVSAFCIVAALAVVAIALLALFSSTPGSASKAAPVAPPSAGVISAARARMQAGYAALPLAFERNQGQTDAQVQYLARGNGYTLFLTPGDAVFSLRSHHTAGEHSAVDRASKSSHNSNNDATAVVRMQLAGASSSPKISASGQVPGASNYFIGSDPAKWRSNVPRYVRVSYQDVYPGVNLAFHGAERQLEFDFLVAPQADPTPIAFHFTGNQGMKTDDSGNLIVSSAAGNVVLHKPVAYQEQNGSRQPVDARFIVKANNRVSFELGAYDRTRELVIDPTVSYSTYLGGTAEDDGFSIAFDGSGNAYVTGDTASTDFPTTTGAYSVTNAGGTSDVFVTKIAPGGASLVYSTYVGGSLGDGGIGIAVDSSGDAFVVGGTASSDFPVSSNPYQKLIGSGAALNAFVFKLNPAGTSLLYSTYLGGTTNDEALGVAFDNTGTNIYVVGFAGSTNFPLKSPLQSTPAGGFLSKLTPANTGTADLLFSTFLGGGSTDRANAVALDSSAANVYVAGQTSGSLPSPSGLQTTFGGAVDAFITKIPANGSAPVYYTYLGGPNTDLADGIAVDSAGNAYVTGETAGSFPLQSALQSSFGGQVDSFVAKLNPTGTALLYSTYLGGSGSDIGEAVAVDGSGNAYVTGQTSSSDFPLNNATQSALSGPSDAYVAEINAAGSLLLFSTYLGGTGDEDANNFGGIAVDSAGATIYVTGNTTSTDFPTTSSAFQTGYGGSTDAFVVQYAQAPFSLSATTPAAVSAGGQSSSVVTLTSLGGYSFAVNLTCQITGSGSPLPACGTFTTNPATPTAAGATSTLTITTTPNSSASIAPAGKWFYAMWLPVAGISLAGLTFGSSRSRRRNLLGFLLLAIVLSALFLMPACGGSSHPGGGGGTGGTPAGNYTVTITGTGTDPAAVTQSVQVTLTVN